MQGEFALDRLQPAAPKAGESLLATQAAEHGFDDRLTLAKNASRLPMLHHDAKRVTCFILGVAFDTSSLSCFRTARSQMQSPQAVAPYTLCSRVRNVCLLVNSRIRF